jgi:hypothetical protein
VWPVRSYQTDFGSVKKMIEPKTVQAVKAQLFSAEGTRAFTILDGASVPGLPASLASHNPEQICLYRGELEPDMAEVAPYLAFLERDAPFTDWVIGNGWGQHWGIFGATHADLKELRKHFRKFLMVYNEKGKTLYFRYYDPRVLRVYLPTCNEKELKQVFGPVHTFLMEDEEPKVGRKFLFAENVMQEERITLG